MISEETEKAVAWYTDERISLSRAAELAGMSTEGFTNILEQRGIPRLVKAPSDERLRKEVELLRG